ANLGDPLGTSARKADKSACATYFCDDSRNENLPEKYIHQNCASRPGRHAARDFCCAGASGAVIYREQLNFSVFPWIECASGGASAAYGASSYGARRTWRQAAGRSTIRSPGLGFAGGPGLGWSTASVNQYASSSPQPSSAGRAGCGLQSAL